MHEHVHAWALWPSKKWSPLAKKPEARHDMRLMAKEHRYEPDPRRTDEVYDLIEVNPLAPGLPGEVVVADTADELLDFICRDLCQHALRVVQQHGDFQLALSGGSTPLPFYTRLMYDPDCRVLPWRRTHLWMVDERCVERGHEQANYNAIEETIVMHADIPLEQAHPIDAMSKTGDEDYEEEIREAFGWREEPAERRLDYVLLGMGADGHTASLFPHTTALAERERWVRFNSCLDATPSDRVTMTYPFINAARFVAIMVTGSKKAAMLQRVASGEDSIEELPILGIQPVDGVLKWYLDKDACSAFVPPEPLADD